MVEGLEMQSWTTLLCQDWPKRWSAQCRPNRTSSISCLYIHIYTSKPKKNAHHPRPIPNSTHPFWSSNRPPFEPHSLPTPVTTGGDVRRPLAARPFERL